MHNTQHINDFFASDGALASIIDGYTPRTAQIEMASAIAQSIDAEEHLIVEAGTGTGKTFAYLAPALLSGKKVIVSTGTKNLQDQLYNKDIPLLRKTITPPFAAALLKGRGNYLCTYRLSLAIHSNLDITRTEAADLAQIKQ